ncbi:hypothetical protein DL1_01175 [Thioclava dalianensis]|uniref:Uncharacterized protein n=1 Tax=Thioclava dalianensis TaxID=1185766 RepID=A0A074TSA0_9RHOB|nr:hypothetical protein [Thioclava dalianensis]KEP71778.1 hypothetical protein DL1_01175 [Thioclava dalianensis]
MEDLALAVAIAVKYIESRTAEEDLDNDIKALEEIAAHLQSAGHEYQLEVSLALSRIGSPDLIEALGLQADSS